MRLVRRTWKLRAAQWIQFVVDTVVGALLWLVSRPQKNKLMPIYDPLLLMSAKELASAIRDGRVSSERVVRAYISRIHAVDPLVNAVVDQRYSEALREAKAVDTYVRSSGKTPLQLEMEKPLLGVPVSIKSNLACKGMKHESGLVSRRGIRAEDDADAVRTLREAGAIPLLTSNVPELSTSYRAYNKLNGHTRNPHDLTRTSGGSTGGESALISSGASLFGLGNDMCGSLRMPACVTGVFAHKPTTGLISNWGLYPPLEGFTRHMLVQGPMCRYAEDLPLILEVLAGINAEKLNLHKQVDFKSLTFYYMVPDLKLNYIPVSEKSTQVVKKVLSYFQKTHGSVVKQISLPRLKDAMDMAAARCKATAGRSYNSLLANDPQKTVSLRKEILKYVLGLSMHTVDSLLFLALETGAPRKGSSRSINLDKKLENLQAEVDDLMKENCVLIHPSCPETAFYSFEAVSKFLMMQYFIPFNVLGLPVTQCPVGMSHDGYPLGVQVVGGKHQDRVTLAVARELELAFGGWCKPCGVSLLEDASTCIVESAGAKLDQDQLFVDNGLEDKLVRRHSEGNFKLAYPVPNVVPEITINSKLVPQYC